MNKWILTLLVGVTSVVVAFVVPSALAGQSQQTVIREKLGEVGAWAVPSAPTQSGVSSRPATRQSQQTVIREKLGEVGAWAVPSTSTRSAVSSKRLADQAHQAIVREKLGEVGAWAVTPTPVSPAVSSEDGFDWNAAGIGAALVFGTMLFGAASVATIRRHRGPLAH